MRERLIELLKTAVLGTHSFGDQYSDATIAKVADHLLQNGVIVPPCKIGDKIWLVYSPRWPAIPGDKGKWFMAEDGVQRILYGAKGMSIETWNLGTYNEKEIGKKIFLTKEGAQVELQRRKEMSNGQK